MGDIKKNIKGKIVIKKVGKNGDDFSDETRFSKKDIRAHDWVEIELDTTETYELGKGLYNYYRLFSGKCTNPYSEVAYIEKNEQIEKIKKVLEGDEELAKLISQIDVTKLNAALNLENLKRASVYIQTNMDNDHETEFWQPFFEKNAWVLSQLFHAPVMFFEGKRYVGGKGMNNHGGQYTDFIYKNDITDNVAIVEIKTPAKTIFDRPYRQSYAFSREFVGAINQLLLQKDTLVKNYKMLLSESDEFYRANNVECILLYGNVGKLNREERDAFENYRNELRSIRIVGFDELLQKVNNLIALFENRPDEQDEDELPF